MEDCCAVCAEPLEWTAYGPCGHTEACSKCVMRLRFVMDDKRCVICQQINPCVLVTRFMGSYTSTLPASEFPQLGVSTPSDGALAAPKQCFTCQDALIDTSCSCTCSKCLDWTTWQAHRHTSTTRYTSLRSGRHIVPSACWDVHSLLPSNVAYA